MVSIALSNEPPYRTFRTIETGRFSSRLFCGWSSNEESEDAGVDVRVAEALADSFVLWGVLFLGGPLGHARQGEWQAISSRTFVARLSGRIARVCWSRDPKMVASMFDQVGFDWSQQGQFAVLFPAELSVWHLEASRIASAIAHDRIDDINNAVGYLRPGDDGDFAEVGFASEAALLAWHERLADACSRAGVRLDR